MPADDSSHRHSRTSAASRYAFFGFLAIALYFLLTEHRAHLVPYLPFLFVVACPLMHFFHHRGHGHPDGKGHDGEDHSPVEPIERL